MIGLEIESEDGARKVFEAEPAGDREATSTARHQHIVQDHGISLQNRSALDRAETNAQTRNAHTSALHVDLAGESRRRPRALDLDVGPERAVHLRDGWCQRLQDSEVHAVGVGADRNRSIEPALLRSLDGEVERKVSFDLQDVLPGTPEIEIRVEPAIGILDDALDERRMEIAEPAIGQTGDAA